MDLVTPNRLRLGRNNQRSPVGPLEVTDKIERLMRLKTAIFECWWEAWLTSAVPQLMPKPKWFVNDRDISVGDVILFNKGEGDVVGEYKFGMVENVRVGADGRIRSATIRYRNAHEGVDRMTNRAVCGFVIIHRIDKIDFMEEHSATLVDDIKKKNRLIQNYILNKETSGALTSSKMDQNKVRVLILMSREYVLI